MTGKPSRVTGADKKRAGKKSGDPHTAISEQIIVDVRGLAWAGLHAQAIALATEVLGKGDGPVGTTMDLLDLRAESYIALGKLDLATKDAKAMGKLAKTAAHKAHALNRQALVQMRTGNLKAAVRSATAAVKTDHNSPALRAQSLFRLSEAQWRTRQNEAAVETAQKAIGLYEDLGDLSGAGRAHWLQASTFFRLNRAEESRRAAHTALELCGQAGDQYGIGNALIALAFTDADIAKRIQHLQQAQAAFETAGYAERQAVALGNLALAYAELGLYPHSHRLQSEVIEITRAMGAKVILTYSLGNIINLELILGALDAARLHLQEFEKLAPELGDPTEESGLFTTRAELAFATGDLETAIRHQKSALKIDQKAQTGREHIYLAELAKMHLAAHDPAAALRATIHATDLHRAQGFAKPDDFTSQAIWWRRTQALNANKKTKEAREALDRAYDFLLEALGGIRDEGLRRNALNKVEDNRSLLQFWVKDGAKRKLPKERLFAHLAIESNLREPFKRLADTGLRLNALKTVAEIQTFLVDEATELSGGERVMLILEKGSNDFSRSGTVAAPAMAGSAREVATEREVVESILPLPSYQSGKGYEKAEDPQDVLKRIHKYLDQARLTRTVQLLRSKKSGLSRIVAPLIAQNQVIGYLYVDMDSLYGAFDDTDRDMLGMLANQAAVALDNAQWAQGLEQKVEERTEELNARVDELAILNSVGEAMAKTLDVKTVTKIVGDKVQSIFAGEAVTIRLYDPAANLIHRAYDFDRGYQDLTDTSFPLGKGLTSKIIESGKPLVFGTYQDMEAAGSIRVPISTVAETESYMGVPIIAGDKVIGVVTVQSYEQFAYNESHVRLLQTLASNMGVAIQNARLFEAEQERVAELAIINSIQQGLASKLDLQAIVDLVGDRLREILSTDDLGVRLYDEQVDQVHYLYLFEHGQRLTIEPRKPTALFRQQLADHLPVFGSTAQITGKFNMQTLPGTEQSKALAAVPIIAGSRVIGGISVESFERENFFDASNVRLMETIAASMGVALENARLFDETQRLFKAEQERVAELAVINSVQEGLASKLDMQGIYDLVGDKLYEIFKPDILFIAIHHPEKNSTSFPYGILRGQKISTMPDLELGGFSGEAIRKRQTIIVNEDVERRSAEVNSFVMAGDEEPLSLVYVPIIAGESVLGVVSLQSFDRGHIFPESYVRLLETLTNSMSVALQNAQSFKAEQERVAELQIINSIQQGLAAELDFQAIVDLVGDKLREVFNTLDLIINWYDEKANLIHILYFYEHGKRMSPSPQPPQAGGIFETFRKTRKPVVFNSLADYQKLNATLIEGTEQGKSYAAVPIISSDRVLGSIGLENYERENAYGESELRLLTTIAASLGTALENARLFDETQRLLKITEDRAAELGIINSVQAGLAAQLDIQAIFDLVGDKVRETLDAQAVYISSYARESNLLYYPYIIEKGKRGTQEPVVFSDKGFGPQVMRTRQPLMINENMLDRAAEVGSFIIGGGEAPKSAIYVPLVIGDEARGAISIQNLDREYAFSDSDFRLLQTLASSLSVALENARLFDEVQTKNAEITESLERETASNDILRVIAESPTDIQPVLDVIARNAAELSGSDDALITLRSGDLLRVDAHYGDIPTFAAGEGIPFNRESVAGRAILEGEPRQAIHKWRGESEYPAGDKAARKYRYRASCAVPLMREGKAIGAISIRRVKPELLTDKQIALVQSFANQAAIAVGNVRLFNETQRLLKETEQRNAELAIINSVQAALAAELNIQGIYDAVGDKIREIFHNRDVGIRIYDPKTNTVHFPYGYEGGKRISIESMPLPDKGFAAYVLRTRETLVFNEDLEAETAKYGSYTLPGTRVEKSHVLVPLVVGDQARGLIESQDMEREHAFSDSDVRLLQTVANSMSVALENARLFDETQRLLKETEQRNAELAIINSVQEGLVAKMDIQGIYDLVGDKIRDIFDAQAVLIVGFDLEKGTSRAKYGWEKGQRFVDVEDSLLSGLERHITGTRQAVLINDHSEERAAAFGMKIQPGTAPMKSGVFVPMIVGGSVRGMVSLQNVDHENAFAEADVRLLTTLTNSMSVALENARLFDETQRLLKETEERNAELAVITSVQQGLASKLEMQAIYDLIGDKIREIFDAQAVGIVIKDKVSDMAHYPYVIEKGERFHLEPRPTSGISGEVFKTGKPVMINENLRETEAEILGTSIAPLAGEEPKSRLDVPMMVGKEVRGVISLQNIDREHAFGDSDLRLLTTLANSMSVALENARLFDETQRLLKVTEDRAAELGIINSVQGGLASKLDMQAIYDLVGDKIREIFDAQSILIMMFDHASRTRSAPYMWEKGERITTISGQQAPFNKLSERLISTQQPLVMNQVSEELLADLEMTITPGTESMKSGVFVPLVAGSTVTGFISLQNVDREDAFSESDVNLLSTLASAMSVALENARLFDETERLLKETEQRNAELAIINKVQQGLASKLEMQAIYDLVGDEVRSLFDAQVVLIVTYDRESNLFHYPYNVEKGERYKVDPTEPRGLSAQMIMTRQPILIKNNFAEHYQELIGRQPEPFSGEPPKSWLGVPLLVGNEARGAISLQNVDREEAYTESDLRLLNTLAGTMSVALENARLFDETERLLKETEDRAAELSIINSIQEGLASKLDELGIVELVGDKIRSVFGSPDMFIGLYDRASELIRYPYGVTNGARDSYEPVKLGQGLSSHVIRNRAPLVINNDMARRSAELGVVKDRARHKKIRSWVGVPIVVGTEAIGLISLQDVSRENAFGDSQVNLLMTLANSMSVALENARLFEETSRLLKETEQRAAELSIINSVQQGMASQLDMQAIYDLVGNKICEIFSLQTCYIMIYDREKDLERYPFVVDDGERVALEDLPHDEKGFGPLVMRTRQPIMINEDMEARSREVDSYDITAQGEEIKSAIYVPILIGDQPRGVISVQNSELEHAYSDSDMRLLTTLASSMSVALESARLFAETEQRAAELAIINSVQQGLASKLDIQASYDLVGDKLRELFDQQAVSLISFDLEKNTYHYHYIFEKGRRLEVADAPITPMSQHIIRTRETLLLNERVPETLAELGVVLQIIPGTEPTQSLVRVPIFLGGEVRGLIGLSNLDRENAFSESDVRLLTTLASSLSVALESARLFSETEQRARELGIINSVQQALASKLEMRAIYDLVGDKLRQLFDTQAILLTSFDMEKDTTHYHYMLERGQRLDTPDAPITQLSRHVIATREPLLVNERFVESLAALGIEASLVPGTQPPKSVLRVPILIGGQVRGLIGLDNLDHEDAFSVSDLRLLQTLAGSLSVALESARLFEETKRNAAELATVNTVSSALASELDISTLIELVGEQIRSIFRAEIAYVALLDETGQTINFPYQYGEEVEPMPFGEGLTSKIIQTGKPLLINKEMTRETREMGASLVGTEAQSYLGVPILVGGKAVGVVSVESTSHEGAFDENDQRLLGTIAANVGSALHNAQLYREAQESRAAAEQANRAKSTFLANMSHELRTPLNAIIGFTRIVRRKADGALPDKQIENLDKVLSSSEHLLGLINTVLDIAKIEAGRLDVIAANFNMGNLAEQCANLAAPLLKPAVSLEKHVDESLGLVYSDQDKIKQIVLNLLSNAAKFTHKGKITLAVDKQDDQRFNISVADSGIGISGEALGRIFEEFQQADTSTTRQYGGTGLGLAISRSLARLLGGDLKATSELGVGSTFTLTLPIKYGMRLVQPSDAGAARARPSEAARQADGSRKTILVIDDDPDAVYLLQESINPNEFNVVGTGNGHEGLQFAREHQPDAILLDILMPDVDGWQVLNDLKEDSATSEIPVILLTIVDKKALGFRLGAAAYLIKPLDPAVVLEALRRVIGERGQPHKHVLVVDDDPHVAEMLGQILAGHDFELEAAEDGEAGLLAVAARRPDVILLDLMMPKLDGFGVIERLRADPGTRDIPIIVISAKELTEDESRKLRDSVAFVMKKQGFDSDRLMEELNSVLQP